MDLFPPVDDPRQVRELEDQLAGEQELGRLCRLRDAAEVLRRRFRKTSSFELGFRAAVLKLRAERKLGTLLAQAKLHGGDRKSARRSANHRLSDLGISQNDSHRWRLEASVSEASFGDFLEGARAAMREPTASDLLRIARELQASALSVSSTVERALGKLNRRLQSLGAVPRRFGCIHVPLPWNQLAGPGGEGRRAQHPTAVRRLSRLPVGKLALPESHLHLWVSNETLFAAKTLMEKWGFQYRSVFVWVKPAGRFTSYWREEHEFLLLGTRGETSFRDAGMSSWTESEQLLGGAKPERIYRFLERASPGPYLEIFGKHPRSGWIVISHHDGQNAAPYESLAS